MIRYADVIDSCSFGMSKADFWENFSLPWHSALQGTVYHWKKPAVCINAVDLAAVVGQGHLAN